MNHCVVVRSFIFGQGGGCWWRRRLQFTHDTFREGVVDHCVNPSHKPRKLLRLASLVSLVGQVLPGLQIVSAVFSLRSVSGAGFTQTAVRTKPRLKTDLMSTHPPAAKPMKTTSFCGSSLVQLHTDLPADSRRACIS